MNELEAVEALHRSSQARLGLAVALHTLEGWSKVQASNLAGGDAWAKAMASAVVLAQQLSSTLAQTYYQLARAIEIGASMGDPEAGGTANLGNYRDSFLRQVLRVATLGEKGETELHDVIRRSEELDSLDIGDAIQAYLDTADEGLDSDKVAVDPYKWSQYNDDERYIIKTLQEVSINALKSQVQLIKESESEDKLSRIEDEHQRKGSSGAGRTDLLAMRGGRTTLERAQSRDRKVLKFARGTSGNPCAFCAMLASRGFVYASAGTATNSYQNGGMRSYHPNCHCFPIARWVDESPLPSLNQEFMDLWDKKIRGKYSGKAALRQWRKIITERQGEALNKQSSSQEDNQ